jgi:hypothetical protein
MADKSTSAAAALFDLRTVIAILFGFYGIVLTIMGIFAAGPETTVKSGGIDLNLWTGIAMLVLAVLFVVWARMKPLNAGAPPADADDRPAHH